MARLRITAKTKPEDDASLGAKLGGGNDRTVYHLRSALLPTRSSLMAAFAHRIDDELRDARIGRLTDGIENRVRDRLRA